jgi:hypothetical protein
MSSDEDEFEGENEQSLREHFAPVGRSIKRTVTSRSIQAYTVSFVGVIILSASLGGAVVGSYATFQEDFGLCGSPILEVHPPEETESIVVGDEQPNVQHLEYEELTPDEQDGFRGALNVINNEEEVEGNIEHLTAFRNGALVEYRGEEYYVVISSLNECVPFGVLPFPLSIIGLIIGAGLYVAPSRLGWTQ